MVSFTGSGISHADERVPTDLLVPLAGLLLTGLLAAYLVSAGRRRRQVETLAADLAKTNAELEVEAVERRQAVRAMREREEELRAVVDHVVVGIITFDEDDIIQTVNAPGLRLFHDDDATWLGRPLGDLVADSDRDRLAQFLASRMVADNTDTSAATGEFVGQRRDYSRFTFELSVNELRRGGRRLFAGIIRDVSEQKRLADVSQRLGRVLENSINEIYIFDANDFHFIQVNRGGRENLGYTMEELKALTAVAIKPEITHEKFEGIVGPLRRQEQEEVLFQAVHQRKDGSTYPVEVRLQLSHHEDPAVFVAIIQDITERLKTERLGRVLENSINEIFVFDSRHLHFVQANRGARENLGYTMAELEKLTAVAIKPDIDDAGFEEIVRPLRRGEREEVTFQTVHQRKDGSTYPVEVRLQLSQDEDPPLFIAIIQDITERLKVDQMKSEFVSVVSHELRTPLTSILGSLGLVAGGAVGELPDKAKPLVEIARNNGERLVRLINDILDIEKIEAGKMDFHVEPLELTALVEHAIEALSAYAQEYGVYLRFENEVGEAEVIADSDRLEQVLANLISNATKFSPKGGTVDIRASRAYGRTRVTVTDHGPGIPEEFHHRIFQRFAQADSSDTRQKGGTGLGLSIAKAIIERLDGTIGFETEAGVGTTFYFELPEQRAPAPAFSSDGAADMPAEEDAASLPPTAFQEWHSSFPTLIVEDDPDVANLIKLLLEQAGLSADVARDAEEARRLVESRDYAAITVDIELPGENGFGLIRSLRASEKTAEIPIVVISQYSPDRLGELNGARNAVLEWLSKPIDRDRLLAVMQRAVPESPRPKPRILHIEDDPDVVELVEMMLDSEADVVAVTDLATAREKLRSESFDLVLLDIAFPDGSGLDLLKPIAHRKGPRVPVIIFSGMELPPATADHAAAVLVKSRNSLDKLKDAVQTAIAQCRPSIPADHPAQLEETDHDNTTAETHSLR